MYTDYVDENETENEEENYYSDDNNNNNDNKEKIKKIAFYVIIFCVALIIIVLLAKGCSNRKNNNTNNNTTGSVSVVINRRNITLEVGEEFSLTGDVLNSKEDNPVIVWHSEDTEVATINDDGVVSAQKEGETMIVASYGGYETTCQVVVTKSTTKATSIRITQADITLKKGAGVLLQVEILPEGANENITYSSNNSSVATVSNTGYVNAIDVGQTTIIAKGESGLTAEVTVTVVSSGSTKIDATNLYLVGLDKELVVGGTAQVISRIEPDNATNKSLSWSTSNSSIATVDSNGVITGKSAGTCTIIASTNNNITARLEVVVHSNSIAVSGITITNGNSYSMKVSGIKKIQYAITPSNATNKKVSFQSSNTKVAVVDGNGLVAAVGVGTAVITVKTEDGNKTALISVNVSSNSSTTPTDNNNNNNNDNNNNNNNNNNNDNNNNNTEPSTCSSYGMITIANNQKNNGTTVSNYSYSQAKPFLKSQPVPGVEITALADCVKNVVYRIYYGITEEEANKSIAYVSANITKVGQTINFNKGDGYYRLEVIGKDTGNSSEVKKEYYAVVKTGESTLELNISKFLTSGNNITLLVGAKSTVGLKNLRYCTTTNISGCSNYGSNLTLSGNNATKSITIENISRTQYICGALYDINGNKKEKCFTIR